MFCVQALLVCPLVVIPVVALVVSRLLGITLWVLVVSGEGELCVVVQLHIAEVILCDDLVAQCADVNKGGLVLLSVWEQVRKKWVYKLWMLCSSPGISIGYHFSPSII